MDKIKVSDYLMKRLSELGISEVFGVPGDYNFHVIDAVEANENLKWIGCCNELNAGYAADGYARIKGLGAVVTTFGVGELSAVNAIAGCFAENVPVVMITGYPDTSMQKNRFLLHHTFGDGKFDFSLDIYKHITAANTILTPENAISEIERVLSIVVDEKKPVYISIAKDVCDKSIVGEYKPFSLKTSNNDNLSKSVDEIAGILSNARNPVIVVGAEANRHNLKAELKMLIEKSGYPAAIMFMGKGAIDETLPNYIGLYIGNLLNPETKSVIESSDCVLLIGALLTDYNTGLSTANLDFSKVINISHNRVEIKGTCYENVLMRDLIPKLTEKISREEGLTQNIKTGLSLPEVSPHDNLTSEYIYPKIQEFLKPNDIVVTEYCTPAFGLAQVKLPSGCEYNNQSLWGAIGWGTPAAFGSGIADKKRRVVLVTGDGSLQQTAQEISSMLRHFLKPVIILVNNKGYTIERLLWTKPMDIFNEIADWNYTRLPETFGGKAFIAQVRTNEELDRAFEQVEKEQQNQLCFVEIITGKMDAPLLAKNVHEFVMQRGLT